MRKLNPLKRAVPIALFIVLGACRLDGEDNAASDDSANAVPTIVGTPDTKAVVGQTYEFAPEATDPDEDVLTFEIDNRPGWASFSPSTGRLSGRPPASAAARVYGDIRISVSDSKAVAELPAYDLEVEADPSANTAPTISGSPATTVTVGNSYAFTPEAVDPDGQVLSFSVDNLPSWAGFDTLDRGALGYAGGSRRRHVRRDRDLGVGRCSIELAPCLRHLGVSGRAAAAGQPRPGHQRVAGIGGDRRRFLFVPTGRLGPRRSGTLLPHKRQARLGKFQCIDRAALRHARVRRCRHACGYRDLGVGWRRDDIAACLHDHRRGREPCPGDHGYSRHERRRRSGLQLPADCKRCRRQRSRLLDHRPAVLGELQPEHRTAVRHAGCEPRRILQQCSDLRERRHRRQLAARIQHSRRCRESGARDQRDSFDLGDGRPGLFVPADRHRWGRRHSCLFDHGAAVLGELQPEHRTFVRHACICGNSRRDRDQRGRWPGHDRAAGLHDHRERAATGQSRTGDQRQPADIGARRSPLRLPADGQRPRRRHARLRDFEQAVLGEFRRRHRSALGHAGRRRRWALGAEYGSRSATAERAHRSPASRSSWSRSRSAR